MTLCTELLKVVFSPQTSLENWVLAQRLNDFFIEKIDKIRDFYQEMLMSYIAEHIPKPVPALFSSFVPLSDTDIQKLISRGQQNIVTWIQFQHGS